MDEMRRWMSRFSWRNVAFSGAAIVVIAVLLVAVLAPAGPCDDLLLGSGGVDPEELVKTWSRQSECVVRTAESSGGFSSSMSIFEVCTDPETGEITRNGLEMLVFEDSDPVWRRVNDRSELAERSAKCTTQAPSEANEIDP